ncbi:hypothetical protein Tco_1211142 [Tanacetum coccineum]
MSFDDLYNNFKIVKQEVKGTASSSSSSNSQNMGFVSSPSSTNEVNTAYGVSTANLSDDTVYAFLASQPNGSQVVNDDLKQIHKDDIEEIDLKWQLALLIIGQEGYFTRECRGPKNQDSRNRNQDNYRRTVNVEETSSKAMLAIDGAGFDWSYMADDEVPTNMALMTFSDSEFNKSEFNLATYKRGLASVEEQLVFYKKNELNLRKKRGRGLPSAEVTRQREGKRKYTEAEQARMLAELINQRKSSKRQKANESSELSEEPRDKEADELSQEELQQIMIIVPEQGMNVEALQTKDDLVMLWSLVKEKFNSTEPTNNKEREIWVELKRLFEPDTDNEEWNRHLHAGREGVSFVKGNSYIDAGRKALGGSR